MHVHGAVPSTTLSHLRALKKPQRASKTTLAKGHQHLNKYKYLHVLLQNPPEKLISPWLCPRQAAAQAHCRFATVCGRWGLNWAQSKSQKITRGIPLRGTKQDILSYRGTVSVPAFTGEEKEQLHPSRKTSWLPPVFPARHPPCHPLHLTAGGTETWQAACFPLWPWLKHPTAAWQPSLGMF